MIVLSLPMVAALCASRLTPRSEKLGLLPFLLEHAMLPGEKRDVFVFDGLQACITTAAEGHKHVGGLLMDCDGGHFELAMVLRIVDVAADEHCTWARLSCVSRCLIRSIRKNKRHGYRVATVSPYSDLASEPICTSSVRAVHERVALQRRKLQKELVEADAFDEGTWESLSREALGTESAPLTRAPPKSGKSPFILVGADKLRSPFGTYESYEVFEETGVLCEHVYVGQVWERPGALGCCFFNARDLGELDDEENGAALNELIATRRAALTAGGHPEGGLLGAVGDVWDVESEEQAFTQLLSFAAAATLSPADRVQALMIKETSQRLALAEEELCDQHALLADLLNAT